MNEGYTQLARSFAFRKRERKRGGGGGGGGEGHKDVYTTNHAPCTCIMKLPDVV